MAHQDEERQRQTRALIALGRERGYLTHADVDDHLPDNFTQTAAMETIVSTFSDMGVAVYEQAPDPETLLLDEGTPAVASDDQVDEEAQAALATVDSEFGRTTDPVRMYLREMGARELLTRAGEIEIAKRIEGGLQDMILTGSTRSGNSGASRQSSNRKLHDSAPLPAAAAPAVDAGAREKSIDLLILEYGKARSEWRSAAAARDMIRMTS